MLILLLRVFFEFAFNMKYLGASLYCQQRTAVFALLNISSDICGNIYVLVKNAMCEPGEEHSSGLKCFEAT